MALYQTTFRHWKLIPAEGISIIKFIDLYCTCLLTYKYIYILVKARKSETAFSSLYWFIFLY